MIVYNSTIKVRRDIVEEWLTWQKEVHIPATLATNLFDDYKFYRLLEQDEEEGPTFIIQYFMASLERYEQYLIAFAPSIEQLARARWGDGFIAFRTLMSSVETGL